VDLAEVLTFFHRRVSRTVHQDYSDVPVDTLLFAVDPKLRGDEVIVQYDPYSSMDEVQLYSLAGKYLGRGRRYEREKGSHPEPEPKTNTEPITPHYLDALRQEHERAQQQQRASGIDYHSARQRSVWPLIQFANAFARLLGRKGGASGLSTQEMEALAAFHARHPRINKSLLREAFEHAESTTIPQILFHFQLLLKERNV
jgi:hypothetical protein